MKTVDLLKEYGLSERESKVYLFLIEHLEANASAISKGTQIPRATVYLTLDELKKKQFISSFKRNKVLYFTPESINQLQSVLTQKLDLTKILIPQLREISSLAFFDQPQTKLFTGAEGIKAVWNDILHTFADEKVESYIALTDYETQTRFPDFFEKWVKKREKLGVYNYLLHPKETKGKGFTSNKKRSVRTLPESFDFEGSLVLYGEKVAIFSTQKGKDHAVIIRSKMISGMFRQFFDFVWSVSKDD